MLNLTGAALATVVNALLGVWPFAAMNLVITVIDVYWIFRLTRERHDEAVYDVVEVGVQDAYLRHVLRIHADDVAATHPEFSVTDTRDVGSAEAADRSAFLVLRGDETVGMVLVRDAAWDRRGRLDYVTERFRDFTPGEFVYRRSGVFAERGFTRLVAADVPGSGNYYSRVGFHKVQGRWERQVEPAAA